MKIVKVKVLPLSSNYGDGNVLGQPKSKKSIVLVKIHTDNNLVGIGETYSGVYVPELAVETIKFFINELIGKDVNDLEIFEKIKNIPYIGRGGLVLSVWSAIDIALWDLRAKDNNSPLYDLFKKNTSSQINIYASGGSAAFNTAQIKKDIDAVLSAGHTAYKMRVGFKEWGEDFKRVEFARKTLGDKNSLMIDAIMGSLNPPWELDTAISKINELSQFNIEWFEEPLHPSNLKDHIKLKDNVPIKIASGEALIGELEYWNYISTKAVDIIQLDVTHCGGFTEGLKIIQMAENYEIPVAMHVWGSPISFAANLNLAFYSDIVTWVEQPNITLDLSKDVKIFESKITEGIITKPKNFVGHGAAIDEMDDNSYKFVSGSGWKI